MYAFCGAWNIPDINMISQWMGFVKGFEEKSWKNLRKNIPNHWLIENLPSKAYNISIK